MNVIGSRPNGWRRDRRRAMAALVDRLEQYAAADGVGLRPHRDIHRVGGAARGVGRREEEHLHEILKAMS